MAPMRGERGGSPARGARPSLPLPRRLIRQIAKHVASSGRSLRRLEVSGRVIDNFDDLDVASDESDMETSQPAVACGNAGALPPAELDDDLTSLSWLQDRNLLRGINLSKSDLEDGRMIASQVIIKAESRTPPPLLEMPSPPHTPIKSPPSPDSPPPSHSKPPYSFSCLIFMAIEAAPTHALPVKEIYAWIIQHFPYFKNAPQGWKNSVRHNLSLNKCFHKVAAAPGIGKGSLWTVDPQHRSTLLQAFGKNPIPAPCDIDEETNLTQSPTKNSPDPQLFPFLARRLAGDVKMEPGDEDPFLARRLADDVKMEPGHDDPFLARRLAVKMEPGNEDPFLARRLAGDVKMEPGDDEYLAAATVLAMKYGPAVLDQLPPEAHLVISRCARDEHSYSGGFEERRTAEALLNLAGVVEPS